MQCQGQNHDSATALGYADGVCDMVTPKTDGLAPCMLLKAPIRFRWLFESLIIFSGLLPHPELNLAAMVADPPAPLRNTMYSRFEKYKLNLEHVSRRPVEYTAEDIHGLLAAQMHTRSHPMVIWASADGSTA